MRTLLWSECLCPPHPSTHKFLCWNLSVRCDGIRRWAFGGCLGPDGEVLMNGISTHKKGVLQPLLQCDHTRISLWAGREPSSNLRLTASRIRRNKVLLLRTSPKDKDNTIDHSMHNFGNPSPLVLSVPLPGFVFLSHHSHLLTFYRTDSVLPAGGWAFVLVYVLLLHQGQSGAFSIPSSVADRIHEIAGWIFQDLDTCV